MARCPRRRTHCFRSQYRRIPCWPRLARCFTWEHYSTSSGPCAFSYAARRCGSRCPAADRVVPSARAVASLARVAQMNSELTRNHERAVTPNPCQPMPVGLHARLGVFAFSRRAAEVRGRVESGFVSCHITHHEHTTNHRRDATLLVVWTEANSRITPHSLRSLWQAIRHHRLLTNA